MKSAARNLLILTLGVSWVFTSPVFSQDRQRTGFGKLLPASSVSRDGLHMVTSVEVSPDGKFLYASAWQVATISVFQRDPMSGELQFVQELSDPDILNGATAVRLSPKGRFAVASAFRSQTAVLYRRDPMDGKLARLDVARNGEGEVKGLQWPVDAAFSPDSRFVYVIDSTGPGGADGVRTGSVTVFRISEKGKLEFIEANTGESSCFSGARGIAIHPDGKTIVVTASSAGTLVVLDRDAKTGKTTVRQVLKDEEGDVHGLDGAMGVALSQDGQFVYTSAGRFQGDSAVGVYKFDKAGKLALVQELMNGEEGLKDFVGGNEITVSPDGRNVYAVASRSHTLVCFQRDPKTGRLTFLEAISNKFSILAAAAGITLSPDGRFVYVAAEENRMVSVFRRKTD